MLKKTKKEEKKLKQAAEEILDELLAPSTDSNLSWRLRVIWSGQHVPHPYQGQALKDIRI